MVPLDWAYLTRRREAEIWEMVSNGCSWGILLFEIMGCVHISRLSPRLESRKLVGGGGEQERVGTPTGRTWRGREEEEGVFQETWRPFQRKENIMGGGGWW